MATFERRPLMTFKDKQGDKYLMYPITKTECVDGLDLLLDAKAALAHTHDYASIPNKPDNFVPASHKSSHAVGGGDPLTATDIGALPVAGGTLTGNLRLKGSGNFGRKLNFGDGEYVCLSEPTDDNLEIKAKNINLLVTGALQKNGAKMTETLNAILSTTWVGSVAPYTQTVNVSGIQAGDNPLVDVTLTNDTAAGKLILESWAKVSRITTASGSITAYCYEGKPAVAMPIQLKVVR